MNKDIYYDYINNLLINKLNIKNHKELETQEYIFTGYRLAQLQMSEPIQLLCMKSYKEIHYFLFQDLYEWAGEYRVVNISKGETNFLPFQFFDNAEGELNNQINGYLNDNKQSEENVCKKLAKIIIDLNYMHPFREGNGRTQREFIRQLALIKGYNLIINHKDDLYMKSSIEDDVNLMYQSLLNNIKNV